MERLSDTEEIRKIESRLLNLISRTFLKGALNVPASQIFDSVKKAFSSKTYELQLDKIIDDVYISSVAWADNKAGELEPSGSAQAADLQQSSCSKVPAVKSCRLVDLQRAPLAAAKDKPLPITEEAILQTKALSGDAAESVTRWLKDNDLYTQHPDQLARQVKDLWDGEKYKARRFAVTFTADLAENTAVHRYASLGIEYLQFFAEVDDRTTPQCRMFNGTIIPTNSLDVQRYRPPLHHHCRSALIPATSKTLKDKDLLIENRDFTQHYNQNFQPLKMRTDIEQVNQVLKDIGKFNEKYRIDQFILDEDIQLRLMKLNLSIAPELPGKTTLKDFIKPDKVEPVKPKYPTGQEIRAKIEKALEKQQNKIYKLTEDLTDLSIKKEKLNLEYEKQLKYMAEKYNGKIVDYTSPEWLADDKKLTDISKAYDDVDKAFYKTDKERTKLMMNDKEAIRKLIYINDGEPRESLLKLSPGGPKGYTLDPAAGKKLRKQQAKETLNFFNKAVAKDLRDNLPPIDIIEHEAGFRPNADIWNAKINMAPEHGTKTFIHETGHHLEYRNPELYQSAKRMVERRTQGEEFVKLRDVTGIDTYTDDEVCKKDNFFNPYIGKSYGDDVGYSEVISTSIAELYANPVYLMKRDPETFDWIVNALRGIYE